MNDISIHALLAESDIFLVLPGYKSFRFLSTLSLRRATREPTALRTPHQNFYPRSPCGERPKALFISSDILTISIHALLAESDLLPFVGSICILGFLSTLSLRRATNTFHKKGQANNISIHALLAESDRVPLAESTAESISIHALLAESDPSAKVKSSP